MNVLGRNEREQNIPRLEVQKANGRKIELVARPVEHGPELMDQTVVRRQPPGHFPLHCRPEGTTVVSLKPKHQPFNNAI